MKILITGARGMLGRELAERLERRHVLQLRDIDDLDICDAAAVSVAVGTLHPDAVINCAAFTDVDGSESAPDRAFAVNAEGVRHLADACAATGALLCHVSTDFVFDGRANRPYRESDEPNPLSVYGKSKLAGEQHIRGRVSKHLIVRTSWLFGAHGNNFVATMLRLADRQDEIRVVADQTGCPTYAGDLALAIEKLVTLSVPHGTYHVCNTGRCTWYDLASRALALDGRATTVIPITTRELGRPALRPAFSAMDTAKFSAATGMKLRHWHEALEDYIRIRKGVRA